MFREGAFSEVVPDVGWCSDLWFTKANSCKLTT